MQLIDERGGLPSASSMDRIVNCPGSRRAEQACPSAHTSDTAAQGTGIHDGLAEGTLEALDLDEQTIALRLKQIEKDALELWRDDFRIAEPISRTGREERFWIHDRKSLAPLASAKLDVYYIAGDTALIINYKTGFLETTAIEFNWQERTEALVLWHEFENLKYIRVAIAQYRFKAHYEACDYSIDDLNHSERELHHALWKAEQPDAPRIPGDWCRYCRARSLCKSAAAWSLLPSVLVGEKEVAQRVQNLSIPELAFIQSRKTLAKQIFDAVEDRLKSLPQTDLRAVGLTLKDNAPSRELNDAQQVFEILQRNQLTTESEFITFCKPGIGRLEETLVPRLARHRGITQQAAKTLLGEILEPAISKKPKAASLQRIKN